MSKCGCGTETDRHSSWCPRLDLEKVDSSNGIASPSTYGFGELTNEEIEEWYRSRGYTEMADMIRNMNEQT